ncbi:MAG: ATP-dependent helicase [Lachnospiraceae bacterium]|nr:ATP-dependent helicase [Lachnospiraceae bacterium]
MSRFFLAGNTAQNLAIKHDKGPCLVLAGPGSGKTFVITERIRYLIEVNHVSPSEILTLTFTKAAAKEMQSRFMKKTNNAYKDAVFGTFHAFYYSILKDAEPDAALTFVDEGTRANIIRALIRKRNLLARKAYPVDDEAVQNILLKIAVFKNNGYTAKTVLKNEADEILRNLFRAYQTYLARHALLDFEDMVLSCYMLLKKDKHVLHSLQQRFTYIQADEFQDISPLQYEVLKLIAQDKRNLFVVGDDDQSIYAFRGAAPKLMRIFLSDFKEARQLTLNVNYRCRENIIRLSEAVIAKNRHRMEKETCAGRQDEAGTVTFFIAQDKETEQQMIIRQVMRLQKQNRTTAIIVRTNAEVNAYLEHPVLQTLRTKPYAPKVLTMHGAKGLEFDSVFLPCLNEGVIPAKRATKGEDLEEERRLLYVGVTRARMQVFLSCVYGAKDNKERPSRFLKELPFCLRKLNEYAMIQRQSI